LTGVYLVNKFKKHPDLVKRENFETIVMHTNEKAIKECRRYIDTDLNRTFAIEDLKNPDESNYEDILAKVINQELGPKSSSTPEVDFIVDMHTTTSNMGLSVILDNENALTWQAAAYLKDKEPKVKIFKWKGDTGDVSFVHSIAKNGFAIEVGAIPQGVLRADIFMETENLIHHLLDFFEKYNDGDLKKYTESIEVYDYIELVDFPRDAEGTIIAMVHPNIQDSDYVEIKQGDPLFITMDGKTIIYEKKETVYAVFINEAAYYEKGFAMCLCRKKMMEMPTN
jgi:aspartoacylase